MAAGLRRQPGILARPVADEAVLLDPRDGAVHLLNPSARILWEQLASPCSEADLVAALSRAFEVGPGTDLAGDVARLLVDLRARGLVIGETG